MDLSCFFIPLIVIIVASSGGFFVGQNLNNSWYEHLIKPDWQPYGSIFGPVWITIYLLAMVSALIYYNTNQPKRNFEWITGLFLANTCFNVFWTYLFFQAHLIGASFIDAILLFASVVALMVLLRKTSKISSWLLLPYAIWSVFAAYLTYVIWMLN
jgi:benzodiazapine receptor